MTSRSISNSLSPPSPGNGRPVQQAAAWLFRHCRRFADRLIASSSLISTAPVLDMREFGWTAKLRADWRKIRDEAACMGSDGETGVAAQDMPLWAEGRPVEAAVARCPRTAAILRSIPGLHGASFARLAPGAHVPQRRGATKAIATCHLGLAVPRDGDIRMRVDKRTVRWAEGETLVFDDSYPHEVWNDSAGARIVLAVRFARPLRNPGRWIARALLGTVRPGRNG